MQTPYYKYDLSLLDRTLAAAKNAATQVERSHIHYAVKANNNPVILKRIAVAGLGADCVSGGEIRQAVAAGFHPEDIVYAGVGKSDWEIQLGLDLGVGSFNVESIEELEVISEIASASGRKARIALRVNPDIGAHTHSNITTGLAENKFGINLEMLQDAIRKAVELPGLDFMGLHFHIGSQILDMDDFKALCNRINDIQRDLETRGVKVGSINVGGGLGVDYEHPDLNPIPDFDSYFKVFAKYLELRPGQDFHCEPGRSLVAQCGNLMSTCLYVKKGSRKQFIILDAGMNDLVRPAMYHALHRIENLSSDSSQEELYDVVGPICESSDCFAKGIYVKSTKRGDLLAIRSAGAYGESMASCYNSRPLPGSEF